MIQNRIWFVILALIGCTLSSCNATPTQESVTVKFTFMQSDEEFYRQMAAQFQKENPYIIIVLNPVSWREMNTVEPSDTDVYAFNLYHWNNRLDQGELLSLDPLMEIDRVFNPKDYFPGTLDILTYDDKTWGVPIGVDTFVLYYNADLFRESRVPFPDIYWTWDDFLNAALALTDPENPRGSIFGYTTTPGFMDALSIVYAQGGNLVDDPQMPAEVTFTDPSVVQILDWYARIFLEYQAAPSPSMAIQEFGGGNNAYDVGIAANRAGMWILPFSERGGLNWPIPWDFDWGMATLPHDQNSVTPYWVNDLYAISAATQHPGESWAWISFLSQQVHPSRVPARISQTNTVVLEQVFNPQIAEVLVESQKMAYPFSVWLLLDFTGPMEFFSDAVEEIIEGNLTPVEAMKWAQDQVMTQETSIEE